jgi:hypothetical protein
MDYPERADDGERDAAQGRAASLSPGLEKARDVPSHRWDGRVLYSRAELDEWMRGGE